MSGIVITKTHKENILHVFMSNGKILVENVEHNDEGDNAYTRVSFSIDEAETFLAMVNEAIGQARKFEEVSK